MKFISFYYDSPGSTYYTECSKRLIKQLNYFNLSNQIENIDFKDSNYQNITLSKPNYILKKLKKLKEPVLWIDIDCYFVHRLDDFSFLSGDVGCFVREHDGQTPHAAMIYFNYNDNAIKFLETWRDKCKKYINDSSYSCGDHCQLIETFNEFKDVIDIQRYYGVCSVGDNGPVIKWNTPIKIGISPGGIDVELQKIK